MQEELKKKKEEQRNARIRSLISIFGSMIVMALWGWTPLKEIIPALPVVFAWISLSMAALIYGIYSVIRKQQVKSLKAQIEDKEN